MAVNNISYPIYPLSTRIEKGYRTKMIPFFFVQYMYRKENRTGKSYKNVYGNVKKYYSHFSKQYTPRMDAAATKLYSVMTLGAGLGTSWEL